MAFNVDLTNGTINSVKLPGGESRTTFYMIMDRVEIREESLHLRLSLKVYRSKDDYLAGEQPIQLGSEVPQLSFTRSLTPAQFASVDTSQLHTVVKNLLEQGSTHAQWTNSGGSSEEWAGLGVNALTIEMPS